MSRFKTWNIDNMGREIINALLCFCSTRLTLACSSTQRIRTHPPLPAGVAAPQVVLASQPVSLADIHLVCKVMYHLLCENLLGPLCPVETWMDYDHSDIEPHSRVRACEPSLPSWGAMQPFIFHVTPFRPGLGVRAIQKKKKSKGGMTGKFFDPPLLTYIFFSRTPPPPFYNYALDPPPLLTYIFIVFASIFNIQISRKTPPPYIHIFFSDPPPYLTYIIMVETPPRYIHFKFSCRPPVPFKWNSPKSDH